MEQKKSIVEQADINIKQKQKNAIINGIIVIVAIVGIIIGVLWNGIASQFLTEDSLKECFNSSFTSVDVVESDKLVLNTNDKTNEYAITMWSISTKDALLELRKSYEKIASKLDCGKVKSIYVAVGDSNTENGDFLITSSIDIEEIRKIEWTNIKTYDDFVKVANVKVIKNSSK